MPEVTPGVEPTNGAGNGSKGVRRNEERWRTYADAVALILGANVWVSMVVLPAIFEGGFRGGRMFAALLPLVVLIVGLWRRSEIILLGLFPAAVMVPLAITPTMATMFVYGQARFILVALGVIAYLFGVAFFTTFHEPPQPKSVRPLSSAAAGLPDRWRRRERIYWLLALSAVACPAALLWWVLYEKKIQTYLGQMYPGRVALMMTGLAIGALAFWLILYHSVWLGILRPHRTGDRDLVTKLAFIKEQAKSPRPRPRPVFYFGVVMAIFSMALLLLR
jgi:hypothetical protein